MPLGSTPAQHGFEIQMSHPFLAHFRLLRTEQNFETRDITFQTHIQIAASCIPRGGTHSPDGFSHNASPVPEHSASHEHSSTRHPWQKRHPHTFSLLFNNVTPRSGRQVCREDGVQNTDFAQESQPGRAKGVYTLYCSCLR